MAVYLVTWDLNKEGSVYSQVSAKIHDRLNSLTTIKHPGLDSVRFVSTDKSAQQLSEYLKQGILDNNDKLVVSRMRPGEYWGYVSTDVWSWISSRV